MKYKKITLIVFAITALSAIFMYCFIYIVGGMNVTEFINFYKYGVVNTTRFIGMTRDEVLKWAEDNRVRVSFVDGTIGQIAFSCGKQIDFYANIREFEDRGKFSQEDKNINYFLTSDTFSVNYFSAYGVYRWIVLTIKDDKVIYQNLKGFGEMIGIYELFPYRYDEYDKLFNTEK